MAIKQSYACWERDVLLPLAYKLMAHKEQPYSNDLAKSLQQACIRRMAVPSEKDFAELALARRAGVR